MPKTPIQKETPRQNPYITKGISKSLLTPCRRVGLSRIRKTPSYNNNSFSESVKTTPDNVETTPLASKSLSDANKPQQTGENISKKKTKVSKCLIKDEAPEEGLKVEEKHCTDLGVGSELAEKIESQKEKFKIQVGSKNESKESVKKNQKVSRLSSGSSDESLTLAEISDCEKNVKCTIGNKKIVVDEKSDIAKIKTDKDAIIKKKVEAKELTSSSNKHSKQKSKNSKEVEIKSTVNKEVSTSSALLEEIAFKDVTNQEKALVTSVENKVSVRVDSTFDKTKKIKRSLSMKRSSSDDRADQLEKVFIQESFLNSAQQTSDLPNQIKNLQKQVKEKQKLVEELKQAEIYKKKHDLKELEESTARWKRGCISALNDLLPLLQGYCPIDMATLLTNLGIPNEKISISPNGDLI